MKMKVIRRTVVTEKAQIPIRNHLDQARMKFHLMLLACATLFYFLTFSRKTRPRIM